jgi:hypothetical protein
VGSSKAFAKLGPLKKLRQFCQYGEMLFLGILRYQQYE